MLIRKNDVLIKSCDRVLECLQNVMAFASTQRINQHILNRLLRSLIDLDKVSNNEVLKELDKIEKNDFKDVLIEYITNADVLYI